MWVEATAVADPGGAEGAMAPPGPGKISHKKDGHQRQPHRFHVSWPPPPYPATGSATAQYSSTNFSNRQRHESHSRWGCAFLLPQNLAMPWQDNYIGTDNKKCLYLSELSKSKSCPMKFKLGEMFGLHSLTKSYAASSER